MTNKKRKAACNSEAAPQPVSESDGGRLSVSFHCSLILTLTGVVASVMDIWPSKEDNATLPLEDELADLVSLGGLVGLLVPPTDAEREGEITWSKEQPA